ncbi:MAG: pyridoxamine 5'-phosphate oxidase family protein [Sphingomonas sp.]|uniref:pyridoxamine 5'-phosphate oxidase family protein n=1 Tax=Sphingomonas sp. TaxID=28214 RepID=UPI0025FB01D5|nr:pyridoxamine 5'-phosphate oxidase family protein [Sphingomonas sp.]MBX3565490.1 pyridoxamine 5'-phosphate oxidase family protein [Sphingomonas sp.]
MAKTLAEIAEMMRDIDFAMLSTHSDGGTIASRPMSNNRDVEYDGDNWFFSMEDTRLVDDIRANPKVALGFQGKAGLLKMKPVFVSIEGTASIIKDKALFEEHWTKDLSLWFEQGVDTPGLVLIKVHGERAHYWDGEDQGDLQLAGATADSVATATG